MKNVLDALDERFPCKGAIKFLKPHRRLPSISHEGAPTFESYVDKMYDFIEVPHEIVKHIYELGWSDAKDAMKEAIS